MQPQYSQGAAPSHHPPPYVPPEVNQSGGSITTSLRQWRKKDYVEKQQSTEQPQTSVAENLSHIARVAPHTYYPRISNDVCHYQHPYSEYSAPYKPTTAPVKYSEIVDTSQAQSIEHITPVIPKHKEKEYSDSCSVASQPNVKQYQDQVPLKQTYPDGSKQIYGEPTVHQYMSKESQVPSFLQKPTQMHQYIQKDTYQQFLPKYGMQSQYPPSYSSEPNNFLAHLNKINPRMAQSIINDTHLRDSQIPLYHTLDYNRSYSQPQRMYHSSIHSGPNHAHRNIPQTYNYPQSYNYNVKSNIPLNDPYSRLQYQHNVSKYLPDYKINAAIEQSIPNISPQHVFNENVQMSYGPMPPKISPNYPHCSQLEYAQHYQHRRAPLAQDYYSLSGYKTGFVQNHQISPDESVSDSHPHKSSLKQYLESWVEEDISGNLPDIIVSNNLSDVDNVENHKGTMCIKSSDAPEQSLYVLETTEIANENLPQFLQLQQFEKLPDNIRGYYHSTSIPPPNRRIIIENNNIDISPESTRVIRSNNSSTVPKDPEIFNENPNTEANANTSTTNQNFMDQRKIIVAGTNISDKSEKSLESVENKVVQIHIIEETEAAENDNIQTEPETVIIESNLYNAQISNSEQFTKIISDSDNIIGQKRASNDEKEIQPTNQIEDSIQTETTEDDIKNMPVIDDTSENNNTESGKDGLSSFRNTENLEQHTEDHCEDIAQNMTLTSLRSSGCNIYKEMEHIHGESAISVSENNFEHKIKKYKPVDSKVCDSVSSDLTDNHKNTKVDIQKHDSDSCNNIGRNIQTLNDVTDTHSILKHSGDSTELNAKDKHSKLDVIEIKTSNPQELLTSRFAVNKTDCKSSENHDSLNNSESTVITTNAMDIVGNKSDIKKTTSSIKESAVNEYQSSKKFDRDRQVSKKLRTTRLASFVNINEELDGIKSVEELHNRNKTNITVDSVNNLNIEYTNDRPYQNTSVSVLLPLNENYDKVCNDKSILNLSCEKENLYKTNLQNRVDDSVTIKNDEIQSNNITESSEEFCKSKMSYFDNSDCNLEIKVATTCEKGVSAISPNIQELSENIVSTVVLPHIGKDDKIIIVPNMENIPGKLLTDINREEFENDKAKEHDSKVEKPKNIISETKNSKEEVNKDVENNESPVLRQYDDGECFITKHLEDNLETTNPLNLSVDKIPSVSIEYPEKETNNVQLQKCSLSHKQVEDVHIFSELSKVISTKIVSGCRRVSITTNDDKLSGNQDIFKCITVKKTSGKEEAVNSKLQSNHAKDKIDQELKPTAINLTSQTNKTRKALNILEDNLKEPISTLKNEVVNKYNAEKCEPQIKGILVDDSKMPNTANYKTSKNNLVIVNSNVACDNGLLNKISESQKVTNSQMPEFTFDKETKNLIDPLLSCSKFNSLQTQPISPTSKTPITDELSAEKFEEDMDAPNLEPSLDFINNSNNEYFPLSISGDKQGNDINFTTKHEHNRELSVSPESVMPTLECMINFDNKIDHTKKNSFDCNIELTCSSKTKVENCKKMQLKSFKKSKSKRTKIVSDLSKFTKMPNKKRSTKSTGKHRKSTNKPLVVKAQPAVKEIITENDNLEKSDNVKIINIKKNCIPIESAADSELNELFSASNPLQTDSLEQQDIEAMIFNQNEIKSDFKVVKESETIDQIEEEIANYKQDTPNIIPKSHLIDQQSNIEEVLIDQKQSSVNSEGNKISENDSFTEEKLMDDVVKSQNQEADNTGIVYQINENNVLLQIADELLEINVIIQNEKKIILVKAFSDATIINALEDDIPSGTECEEIDNQICNNVLHDNVTDLASDGDSYLDIDKTEDFCSGVHISEIAQEVCIYNEEVVSSSTEIDNVLLLVKDNKTTDENVSFDDENLQIPYSDKKSTKKKKHVSWEDHIISKRNCAVALSDAVILQDDAPCNDVPSLRCSIVRNTKTPFGNNLKTKAALKFIGPLDHTNNNIKKHNVPSKTIKKSKPFHKEKTVNSLQKSSVKPLKHQTEYQNEIAIHENDSTSKKKTTHQEKELSKVTVKIESHSDTINYSHNNKETMSKKCLEINVEESSDRLKVSKTDKNMKSPKKESKLREISTKQKHKAMLLSVTEEKLNPITTNSSQVLTQKLKLNKISRGTTPQNTAKRHDGSVKIQKVFEGIESKEKIILKNDVQKLSPSDSVVNQKCAVVIDNKKVKSKSKKSFEEKRKNSTSRKKKFEDKILTVKKKMECSSDVQISVQENSITSSTSQEHEILSKERNITLIQQITDDWEDDSDDLKFTEASCKRRLSLQEYNSRKHTNSVSEPEPNQPCDLNKPELIDKQSELNNEIEVESKNDICPESPVLSINFNNKTYSRHSATSISGIKPPPNIPSYYSDLKFQSTIIDNNNSMKEPLSSAIELQLPKINRSTKRLYNQEYLKSTIVHDLQAVNTYTISLIKQNQQLMQRFLEQKRLTASELETVKAIIRYKRLVQHLSSIKISEMQPDIARDNFVNYISLANQNSSNEITNPVVNLSENQQLHLTKNKVILQKKVELIPEKRKRKRFRFLYSDEESESPKLPLTLTNNESKIDKICCPKKPRLDNSVPDIEHKVVDYSVHQSNSQGQLTLVFKRNFKSDPKMQPFVRIERLPGLDILAKNWIH